MSDEETDIIDLYELPLVAVAPRHRDSLKLVKGYSVFLRINEIAPDIA